MSLTETIRSATVPIHPAGRPFVAGFAVASALLGMIWPPLFWMGMLLTAWCAYFFRDPDRVTPTDDRLVISPADGIVSAVGLALPPSELGLAPGEWLRISVFMNVFSVHVNRAPVRGTITRIAYRPGAFINAALDKASAENERNGLVIESPHGPIAAVQIAGLIARRILCWGKEGQAIGVGERFGLIRFGSRVDVFLPVAASPAVTVGQTAIAGETVLAEFGERRALPLYRKA